MKLTVLGSGTLISDASRATTGFALEFGGQAIAVDLGFGCLKNMQKAGISLEKVNSLFFTHWEHPDHINDLTAFLFSRKGQVELSFWRPLQVNLFGGPGFRSFAQKLLGAYPVFEDLPFKVSITELDSFSTKKFPSFILNTKPMRHVKSSIGMRFSTEEKSVALSGDTEANENLLELAKEADLLVAECSYSAKKTAGHMNVEEVTALAAKAKAKALLLSHMYPEAEQANLKKLAAKRFKGTLHVAKDLMKVSV